MLHQRFKQAATKSKLLRLLRPTRAPPQGIPFASAEPWQQEPPADEHEQSEDEIAEAMSEEGGDAVPDDNDVNGEG